MNSVSRYRVKTVKNAQYQNNLLLLFTEFCVPYLAVTVDNIARYNFLCRSDADPKIAPTHVPTYVILILILDK